MKDRHCDIFISYRRDGGDMTAMYIYQSLKERKYDVFYDLEVLRAGRFNDALLEYIGNCKDFVLILSPNALDRCSDENDWVRKEIAEALRLKKNIIPIMLKGFTFPETLPDEINDIRYQNGMSSSTEYFAESMNRLCTKYLNSKPKKNTTVIIAAVCVLAIALIACGALLMTRRAPAPLPVTTQAPTEAPTEVPTEAPTEAPTEEPTEAPTDAPTEEPTEAPTEAPAEPTYSREDLFTDAQTEHTVLVKWKGDESPIRCAFANDAHTGHGYVFVNCPATAAGADTIGGDGHLVEIQSEEELKFLAQWAQRDDLHFNEVWIRGWCPVSDLQNDQDTDTKLLWERSNDLYFHWADGQPDRSGQWLQLWASSDETGVVLTMDDLLDDMRRPFILEFDRALQDGEEIDLCFFLNGEDEYEGYGERFGLPNELTDGIDIVGRLDTHGVFVISGTGVLGLSPDTWYNPYIREVIVREGISGIGFHGFDGCSNLTRVSLPNGLRTIGEMAFAHTALTDITIPEGVTEIGFFAFGECRHLASIDLPETLTSIGACAFLETALSEITIPSSVTQIGDNAFDGLTERLTIRGEIGSCAESYANDHGIRFEAID